MNKRVRETRYTTPRLREWRTARRMPIRELSEASGVSTEVIFRLEHEPTRKAQARTRERLAHALGLDHPLRLTFSDEQVDRALGIEK